MKKFLIIKLIVWLGWLPYIALAQLELSGAITGSVSFPEVGITCLGNLAAFITSLLRRRFDLEMGASDFMAARKEPADWETKRYHTESKEIKDELIVPRTTKDYANAHVVMLSSSTGMSNSSITKFMKYISNAHDVNSILLSYSRLKNSTEVALDIRECPCSDCNCIVFRSVEDITSKLVKKILARDKDSGFLYLLPSLRCQQNSCHGCCNPDPLHEKDNQNLKLKKDCFNVESLDAAYYALDFEFMLTQKERICICIPVNDESDDKWTKLLVRSFKSKDQQDKGAIVMASDTLQSYLDGKYLDGKREDRAEQVTYRTLSLILPRLVEISINLVLTLLFKVDGFSSSLAARRGVRSFVVDSKGNGLPADVFLSSALVVVKSNSVCQVLKFRGTFLGSRTLLSIVGCVNLISSITWAVLIAFSGGAGKWYKIHSMEPSKPRVAVIIAAIGIGFGMDCFQFSKMRKNPRRLMLLALIVIADIVFSVAIGIVAFGLNKDIAGRWIYGALQVLVWLKWGIGSYLLPLYSPEYVPTRAECKNIEDGRVRLQFSSDKWVYEGTLVYSSSFFLNAVLAGVRGNWAGVWRKWTQSG